MKSHKSVDHEEPAFKLWTFAEAVHSLPYVRTILKSMREHAITTNQRERELGLLKSKPGRPNRSDFIQEAQLQDEARREYDAFVCDAEELEQLGIACVDPVQGEVAYPFVYNENVAWFHHDLFDQPKSLWWRLDTDSLNTRRPIVGRIREGETRKVS